MGNRMANEPAAAIPQTARIDPTTAIASNTRVFPKRSFKIPHNGALNIPISGERCVDDADLESAQPDIAIIDINEGQVDGKAGVVNEIDGFGCRQGLVVGEMLLITPE